MAARGNAFNMAQRVCLGCAKHVDNRGLSRNVKKLDDEDYWMDAEGEAHRRRTVKNLPKELFNMAPFYWLYKQWQDRGEYFSNEQFQSAMQVGLFRMAVQQSKGVFYDISATEQLDIAHMPLEPLDIEKDILDDFTILLIGRRRSGKTWASRYLMYNLKDRFPFGAVITGTKLNNFWSSYIPTEFIYDIGEINTVIDVLFARQTYLIANPQLGIDPRMFLVLDDVMGDEYTIRFSEQLNAIFTNGRHFKIFLLITMQDPKGVGPKLRENTDLAVIFRVYEGGRKEVIYKEWLSYFNSTDKLEKREIADFFWNHTGKIDEDTLEPVVETHDTEAADDEGIPQAVCVLQARTTSDLQKVFKKLVSEDPGDFYLGRKDYYEAALSGEYGRLYGTSPAAKKKKNMRYGPKDPDQSDDDDPDEFPNARGPRGGPSAGTTNKLEAEKQIDRTINTHRRYAKGVLHGRADPMTRENTTGYESESDSGEDGANDPHGKNKEKNKEKRPKKGSKKGKRTRR
jgi:hypothetical protein